jgi:hypothetical protein
MIPPKTNSTTFEKVQIGNQINGTIAKIEYDMEKKFTWKGKDSIQPGVRFVFELEGYEYPHRSRWMKFNVGEKANLYKKYISKLVANAHPDMQFDLDLLVGMGVKTLWDENGDFQNLDSIFPIGNKLVVKENDVNEEPIPPEDDFIPEIDDSDVPL